ncbi:recombinase family protein [Citricoccus muralis]|uniref:Resolvase-like protein n=1 Tax=Citricoccus muralis TaxID=169134 RepID=A0A3D9L7D7_9MICC|nr:recombinase family protein [Citricoccus muralis]REE02271.1 resolvase-like protein [Citricoccus muralis]
MHGPAGTTGGRGGADPRSRECVPGIRKGVDRLGRTVRGLVELLDSLKERGVAFRSLSEGVDTTAPQGRLMFNIIASVAEMERELIRERTMAGLAAAAGKGGWPPRLQLRDVREARRLREDEQRSLDRIASKFKVSRSTVVRALRQDGLVGDGYAEENPDSSPREPLDGPSSQSPAGRRPGVPR